MISTVQNNFQLNNSDILLNKRQKPANNFTKTTFTGNQKGLMPETPSPEQIMAHRGISFKGPKGSTSSATMTKPDSLKTETISGIPVIERFYSTDPGQFSVGIANVHTPVQSLEDNQSRILDIVDGLKKKNVNMIIFPEFSLSGYFWNDNDKCRDHMDQCVMSEQKEWLKKLESRLDDTLKYIVINNLQKADDGMFHNTTFIIQKGVDYLDSKNSYNKIFLPEAEKAYTQSGKTDNLVLDTEWGKFGFTTCYDYSFSQLPQEYAMIDGVDAIIQVASWRKSAKEAMRDYPGMNVHTDTYYRDLWNMLIPAHSATNQVWTFAANSVGTHEISGDQFAGGSGIWAPSGMKLLQASHNDEKLLVVHNINIKKERQNELSRDNYGTDFRNVYYNDPDNRSFSRFFKVS